MFKYNGETKGQISLKIISGILIITLVILLSVFGIKVYKSTRRNTRLQALEIYGYKLDKPFKENEYKYKVTVDKDYIQVSCDTTNNIVGCNQNIDLTNEEEYVHEIVVDPTGKNKIYLLYITHETKEEEPTKPNEQKELEKAPWVPEHPEGNVNNWVPAIAYNEPKEPEEPIIPVIPENPVVPEIPIGNDIVDIPDPEVPTSSTPLEPEINPEPSNINIESITGNPVSWTRNNIEIKVNVSSDKNVLGYSFDGGVTWQDSNTKIIDRNQVLEVIAKDVEGNVTPKSIVNITKIDKEVPQPLITIDSIEEDGINLKVTANDVGSGIDTVSFSGGSYTSEKIYKVTKEGTYFATVKDKAGNESEKVSIDIKDNDFDINKVLTKTFTATFDGNGSDLSTSLTCTTEIGQTSCKVTAPKIVREQWETVGWSTNQYAIEKEYSEGVEIELTEDKTFYAITSRTLMAHFNVNGGEPLAEDEEYQTCNLYNTQTTCTLKSTVLTKRDGWNFIGWSTNKDSHAVDVNAGEAVVLSNDKVEFYAITAKELLATFEVDGETTLNPLKTNCVIYNSETECKAKAPTAKRTGYTTLGWAKKKGAKTSDILQGQEITIKLNENLKYYIVSEESKNLIKKKEFKVTFHKNGADSIGTETLSCMTTGDSCTVKAPTITRNGYKILGWSINKDAKNGEATQNNIITLNQSSIDYYAITAKAITVTFDPNGSKISKTSDTCTMYNLNKNCKVQTPTITRNLYTVLGWGETISQTNNLVKPKNNVTVSNNKTYYAITKKNEQPKPTKTFTAEFYSNGASSVGNHKLSCTTTGDSCTVKAPTITARDGYKVLGWSTRDDDVRGEVSQNATITLTQTEIVYYAITSKTVTATFKKTKYITSPSKDTTLTCTLYNTQTSCQINRTPSIVAIDNYGVSGWSQDTKTTSAEIKPTNSTTIIKNTTFYPIVNKRTRLTATFHRNGATKLINRDSKNCKVNDDKIICSCETIGDSCQIQSPVITRTGGEVKGWSNSLKTYATVAASGARISLVKGNNYDFYATTSKKIKITFNKNNHDMIIDSQYKTCDIYNANKCSIKIPYAFDPNYMVLGFNSNKQYSGDRPQYIINNYYEFDEDTTLYADFTSKFSKDCKRFNYLNYIKKGNIYIMFDKNLSNNTYSNRKEFINFAYSKMPVLFKNSGTIRMLSRNNYESVETDQWRKSSGGYSFGDWNFVVIDVLDYEHNFSNSSLIHELGHKFAFERNQLDNTSEWKNLYKKYKNIFSGHEHYTQSATEFWAATMTAYFFQKYTTDYEYQYYIGNSTLNYKNIKLPTEITSFIEKNLK